MVWIKPDNEEADGICTNINKPDNTAIGIG